MSTSAVIARIPRYPSSLRYSSFGALVRHASGAARASVRRRRAPASSAASARMSTRYPFSRCGASRTRSAPSESPTRARSRLDLATHSSARSSILEHPRSCSVSGEQLPANDAAPGPPHFGQRRPLNRLRGSLDVPRRREGRAERPPKLKQPFAPSCIHQLGSRTMSMSGRAGSGITRRSATSERSLDRPRFHQGRRNFAPSEPGHSPAVNPKEIDVPLDQLRMRPRRKADRGRDVAKVENTSRPTIPSS